MPAPDGCKRFIDEKLDDALSGIDAVVVLGAGVDTRPYRLARRSDIAVYDIDLPVNIERKAAVVRRVLGQAPPSVRLVPVDFECGDLAPNLPRPDIAATIGPSSSPKV